MTVRLTVVIPTLMILMGPGNRKGGDWGRREVVRGGASILNGRNNGNTGK